MFLYIFPPTGPIENKNKGVFASAVALPVMYLANKIVDIAELGPILVILLL